MILTTLHKLMNLRQSEIDFMLQSKLFLSSCQHLQPFKWKCQCSFLVCSHEQWDESFWKGVEWLTVIHKPCSRAASLSFNPLEIVVWCLKWRSVQQCFQQTDAQFLHFLFRHSHFLLQLHLLNGLRLIAMSGVTLAILRSHDDLVWFAWASVPSKFLCWKDVSVIPILPIKTMSEKTAATPLSFCFSAEAFLVVSDFGQSSVNNAIGNSARPGNWSACTIWVVFLFQAFQQFQEFQEFQEMSAHFKSVSRVVKRQKESQEHVSRACFKRAWHMLLKSKFFWGASDARSLGKVFRLALFT